MKQAFVVSTILVLTISLLSVGMVQAPKPPKDTPLYSIEITGLVGWSKEEVVGDKKGWNFPGGETAELTFFEHTDDLHGWAHWSPGDQADFTLGDSGFGSDTLFLGLNKESTEGNLREVFRIQIILDVGRDKGPDQCYASNDARVNEVHIVWEWQERGRSGKGDWVLIDEGHPRSIEHTGYIEVCIDRLS